MAVTGPCDARKLRTELQCISLKNLKKQNGYLKFLSLKKDKGYIEHRSCG